MKKTSLKPKFTGSYTEKSVLYLYKNIPHFKNSGWKFFFFFQSPLMSVRVAGAAAQD